MVVLLSVVEMV